MSWDVKDADEKFKDLSARGIKAAVLQKAGRHIEKIINRASSRFIVCLFSWWKLNKIL
jgi:hypothetical protein